MPMATHRSIRFQYARYGWHCGAGVFEGKRQERSGTDSYRDSTAHGTRRVIPMVHSDCGGFDGAPAGAAHYERELAHPAASLLKAFPGIQAPGYFVNLRDP